MKEFFTEFVPGVAFILALCAVLIMGAVFITVAVETNTMQRIGYEAKQVNFDCVAKRSDGKWVPCNWVKYGFYNSN